MSEQDSGLSPISESQLEILEEATSSYQAQLMLDDHAQEYLAARGIGQAEALTARLGVVTDEPFPGHAYHVGKLAIPYINAKDQVVQLRFRCIQNHDHQRHGKYATIAGDPARPYNVRAIAQAKDELHIAEGEFDAMILEKCGFHAIAVPGVNSWKPHYRELLLGFQWIYLWADPDEAGAGLVNTVTRILPRTVPMRLTAGDVSDTYKQGGKAAIREIYERYKKEDS